MFYTKLLFLRGGMMMIMMIESLNYYCVLGLGDEPMAKKLPGGGGKWDEMREIRRLEEREKKRKEARSRKEKDGGHYG